MKATHSNPFIPKVKRTALSVLLSVFLISMLVTSVMGATVYGTGQDRHTLLEISGALDVEYEASLNASVPQDISQREIFTGDYTYTTNNSLISFNIIITTELSGTNESGVVKTYNNTFTVVNTANATATYTLLDLTGESDVELLDNATVTVVLTTEPNGAIDTSILNVNMVSQSVLAFRGVTDLIIAIFPLIVVIGIVLPVLGSLLETLKK